MAPPNILCLSLSLLPSLPFFFVSLFPLSPSSSLSLLLFCPHLVSLLSHSAFVLPVISPSPSPPSSPVSWLRFLSREQQTENSWHACVCVCVCVCVRASERVCVWV